MHAGGTGGETGNLNLNSAWKIGDFPGRQKSLYEGEFPFSILSPFKSDRAEGLRRALGKS